MDKERLDALLDYYRVLSDSNDGFYRLDNVANAIERELDIVPIPVCGGSNDFDGHSGEVCEPND